MSAFIIFSIVILVAVLSWTFYHLPILFSGLLHSSVSKCHYKRSDTLPTFSLIVPVKDEEAVIARCLRALLNLDYPKRKMEIIVVDGNSEDNTLTICREFSRRYPKIIKVVSQRASKGKPAALNLALSIAKGEIMGVFDADSVPERDTLQRVASYFRDPAVAAVQGRTSSLNEGENMLTKIAAKEEKAWNQALLKGRERLKLFVPLTGSCQFVRRKVLEEVGGWKEDSLAEDVELALTLTERGCLVKYAPDVNSWQETPSKLKSLITQRTRWYRGYMEAALRYGRLLKKLSRKTLDAEILLTGPYIMVLCLLSYLNWIFCLLTSPKNIGLASLAMILTAVTLFSMGIALSFTEKPVRAKSLLWIPGIYLYWFLQTLIAGSALLRILLHEPRVWEKTIKHGSTTKIFPSAVTS